MRHDPLLEPCRGGVFQARFRSHAAPTELRRVFVPVPVAYKHATPTGLSSHVINKLGLSQQYWGLGEGEKFVLNVRSYLCLVVVGRA